jgi:hypothetical protein
MCGTYISIELQLVKTLQNLQEENQALQVSLESVTDEFLSAKDQSPHDITKRTTVSYYCILNNLEYCCL